MNRKSNTILTAFLILMLLVLTACGSCGDKVERFAEASPGNGANIAIPGYETLVFKADSKAQTVNLTNPPENACTFVLSLTMDGGETLWTGKALSPGEAFTRITLTRTLEVGEYPARLHYDCYGIEAGTPLNGAEIELTLEVK